MPEFNHNGLLEPGVHPMTVEQIKEFFGYNERRRILIGELERFIRVAETCGMRIIKMIIDGSFITDKQQPGDIDLYFIIDVNSVFTSPNLNEFFNLMNHNYTFENFSLDSYCHFNTQIPVNNFVDFFQYIGPKTAAIKKLGTFGLKGIVELR